MAGLVTKETDKDVYAYIDTVSPETKKQDSLTLIEMMQDVTKREPKIWGDNFIIGFGKYQYTRKNSNEVFEWFYMGFAPRKTKLTLYLTCDLSKHEALLKKLGKFKSGAGCIYINKLADVDLMVLRELMEAAYRESCKKVD